MPYIARCVLAAALVLSMNADRRGDEPEPGRRAPAFLLLHDAFGDNPCPTPAFLRDHREYLETLPFDGIVVYLRRPDRSDNLTMSVLTRTPLGPAVIAGVLAPLHGISFTTLTRKFALVIAGDPPDVFDDWSVPTRNLGDLARAVGEAGWTGICFDNENYFSSWADYPEGVRYPTKSLREYREQAQVRGREAMEAMVDGFPDITVLSFHGPYVSDPRAPAPLFPQWQSANELLGPFFCGLVEGAGSRAACVDGGELYRLRTEDEFRESYRWRKHAIASSGTGDSIVPESLRSTWPERVQVGFGVYDRPFGGIDMNPAVLRRTLARALRQTDGYVWLYVEGAGFLRPAGAGGADEPWRDAVRLGKEDAR